MLQNPQDVKVSVTFTRINEIDTVNEKFMCEATIYATWYEDIQGLNVYSDGIANDGQHTKSLDDANKLYCWNPNNLLDPQLFIDNVVGDIKEKDVKYQIQIVNAGDENADFRHLEVQMIKRIEGRFFEKLELYHFPFDVQDLSLVIMSHRTADEIRLIEDKKNPSKVTKAASLDKHVWKLHEHVNIRNEKVQVNEDLSDEKYCHSSILFQARVSRKPGYFVANCLLPTLMITLCVIFTYVIDYKRYQYRLSLLFTLMLTTVTFRFSIHGRVMPMVSYLTFMDMYSMSSIITIFLGLILHTVFIILSQIESDASVVLAYDVKSRWFIGSMVVLMHLIQSIWFVVAFRKRSKLYRLDKKAASDKLKCVKSFQSLALLAHDPPGGIKNSYFYANQLSLSGETKKTLYLSIGKLQNSSVVILKPCVVSSSNEEHQKTFHQNNDQKTLTTPTAMAIFSKNNAAAIDFSMQPKINANPETLSKL